MANRRGFTLIELLVVIAIIAVLAGLLLPVLARAKASAQALQCKNNLKQVGVTLNLYVNDFASYPVLRYYDPAPHIWVDPLCVSLGYPIPISNNFKGVFVCPSGVERRLRAKPYRVSYGYNASGWVHGSGRAGQKFGKLGLGGEDPLNAEFGGNVVPTRESDVMQPTDMMAVADDFSGSYDVNNRMLIEGVNGVIARAAWPPNLPWPDEGELARKRHSGKLNVVFCDGHVEGVKVHSLFFDKSDEALRRWNLDHMPHGDFR